MVVLTDLAASEFEAVLIFDNLAFSTQQSAISGALRALHPGVTTCKSFRFGVDRGGPPAGWVGRDIGYRLIGKPVTTKGTKETGDRKSS